MAVKEIPTNIAHYYKLFKESNAEELKKRIEERDFLRDKLYEQHRLFKKQVDKYKIEYKINLNTYEEFVNNQYSTGKFFKDTKGIFMNRRNDYKLVSELFDLFIFAKKQKELYELEEKCKFLDKCAHLTKSEYTNYLRTFYTEVHKKMVIDGNGYRYGNNIGVVVINRVKTRLTKPILDFAATKKREAELKAAGKRIFNQEEADWCKKNGIEYHAEDKRVFKKDEYFYQVILIYSRLPGCYKFKLETTDRRGKEVRGMTNQQIIDMCDNNINKICEMPLDVKTKLTLCNLVDKTLYLNFIRNENQQSYKFIEIDRKD